MKNTDRRQFLQLMGMGALKPATLNANTPRLSRHPRQQPALGTIRDVEHIVILMQENNAFDKYFRVLCAWRAGFLRPARDQYQSSLASGTGSTGKCRSSCNRQVRRTSRPDDAEIAASNSGSLGRPADGAPRHTAVPRGPRIRSRPGSIASVSLTCRERIMAHIEEDRLRMKLLERGRQYDGWAVAKGPITMAYLTREDSPLITTRLRMPSPSADAWSLFDHGADQSWEPVLSVDRLCRKRQLPR